MRSCMLRWPAGLWPWLAGAGDDGSGVAMVGLRAPIVKEQSSETAPRDEAADPTDIEHDADQRGILIVRRLTPAEGHPSGVERRPERVVGHGQADELPVADL